MRPAEKMLADSTAVESYTSASNSVPELFFSVISALRGKQYLASDCHQLSQLPRGGIPVTGRPTAMRHCPKRFFLRVSGSPATPPPLVRIVPPRPPPRFFFFSSSAFFAASDSAGLAAGFAAGAGT